MSRRLQVYLHERLIGHLDQSDDGGLSFRYAEAYLAAPEHGALSLSLPLGEQPYDDRHTRPYFGNLLPEGPLRNRLARHLGLSEDNDFALLQAVGGECAGAVSLLPEDAPPPGAGDYRELQEDELAGIIRDLPRRPLLAGDAGIRLSLAGAQDKLPLYRDQAGTFHLPLGPKPSNVILKPAAGDFEGIAENEYFCMKLAAALGLSVPDAALLQLNDTRVYLVERFDRRLDSTGEIRRLHQEDFCQALGKPANMKYEAEGGPSLGDCFALLTRHAVTPAPDRLELLRRVLFNWLIGNMDAHAKNFALLLEKQGPALAPAYDLISTDAIDGLSRRMAMRIGDEQRPDWLRRDHFETMSKGAGINPRLSFRTLEDMVEKLSEVVPEVTESIQDEHGEIPSLSRITSIIERRQRKARILLG
ncbi:type II toxin-antitoxin system HipA family toxin [Gammaproteobacteria bacterium AB-CW1]|uniref:Type II toxin-antitoxin system HipA family toxin n=1 Tax=Natronospira elongata TaxID=3110268 RepID=A0AAP6JGY1_9GAMM|nr:type II toxin-antitoxin system HipA family toxin [Gammaproteobacteria bacterium AB-CW1]